VPKEISLKKFVFLTYGFEKPRRKSWTPGESGSNRSIRVSSRGHFPRGREISKAGVTELPLGPDSITGLVIVEAASFEDAERMAQSNPYVSSIRLYEMMTG
jgi:hypothetical protein